MAIGWARLIQADGVVPAFHDRQTIDAIVLAAANRQRANYGLEMSNKKPLGSLIGAIIFGAITAFFLLAFFQYQSAPDGALTSAFALLLAFPFGIGFMVFLLVWAVKTRKYKEEQGAPRKKGSSGGDSS